MMDPLFDAGEVTAEGGGRGEASGQGLPAFAHRRAVPIAKPLRDVPLRLVAEAAAQVNRHRLHHSQPAPVEPEIILRHLEVLRHDGPHRSA